MPELFTVNEAAAIAEISPETIRTALEKKSVMSSHGTGVGKATRHHFSSQDVLLLKVLTEFPFALSKHDKESLAQLLVRNRQQAAGWSIRGSRLEYSGREMRLSIELKSVREKLNRNLALYRWGKKRVVSRPDVLGGEPVFRGTRVPLQHVAGLFRKGIPEEEIREDFPHLKARDLKYARLATGFIDKPGRPRKRVIAQRESRIA